MRRSVVLAALFFVRFARCFGEEAVSQNRPIEFAIVIPSYNNEKWCIGNLKSIVSQDYPYFSVYYINDCSTDNTGQLVDEFVSTYHLENKCKVLHNRTRKGALANLFNAIHSIEPHKVIVTVDGDDRLSHPHVLQVLASAYADRNVWMTYGDFVSSPVGWGTCCAPLSEQVLQTRSFRSSQWVFGHLRTFYAKLFQMIKKEDLLWQGEFFPVTGDMAFMFPMAEMASQGHIRFIPQTLYLYNVVNPINDHRVTPKLLNTLDTYIRELPHYQALNTLF